MYVYNNESNFLIWYDRYMYFVHDEMSFNLRHPLFSCLCIKLQKQVQECKEYILVFLYNRNGI